MNLYRTFLKLWIALASLVGFVAGWSFIARAAEMDNVTYVGNTTVTMPNLPPIPIVEGLAANGQTVENVQTFTVNVQPQTTSTQPLRTGGS